MRRFAQFLINTNIYAVILIAALCLISLWQTENLEANKELLAFILASSLFVYPFHRLFGAWRMPVAYRLERHAYILRVAGFVLPMVVMSAVLSAFYFFSLDRSEQVYVAILSVFTLLYTFPVIPVRGKWIALRAVPGIKVFVISAVMALITCDVFMMGEVDSFDRTMFAVERFLFILAITIPFDIRDVKLDSQEGVLTLPIWLGVENAKKWCLVMLSIFGTLSFLQYMFGADMSLGQLLANWVSQVTAAIAIRNINDQRSPFYYSIAIEGVILLYASLALLAYWLS